MKWVEKQERKKQKTEDKKKEKKPDGPSPFQLCIFLTMLTPIVGPLTLMASTYMLRIAFANIQAIAH